MRGEECSSKHWTSQIWRKAKTTFCGNPNFTRYNKVFKITLVKLFADIRITYTDIYQKN